MCGFVSYPRTKLQKRSRIVLRARDVEAPRTIRCAHDAPRITGGVVGVQQNRADRAATRSFLVLVRPASVVSERFAAEQIRLRGCRGWIVDQHHEDLAAIIVG